MRTLVIKLKAEPPDTYRRVIEMANALSLIIEQIEDFPKLQPVTEKVVTVGGTKDGLEKMKEQLARLPGISIWVLY